MKNILLVNPAYHQEDRWVTEVKGASSKVLHDMVPLGLATVAGLTPETFHVDIWDETIHGLITDTTRFKVDYDLVGVTSHTLSLSRCREIAAIIRKRNILIAIGGPGVSATPYAVRQDFDVLFLGEVEKTWPQFLEDWKVGAHRAEYRQINKPDLTYSPLPKWDSLAPDLQKYAMGCVQTTRGCPFDCEFCDVIYLFGRRLRHKPVDQVIEEVKTLERLGMSAIFFSDDEFAADPKYTKKLLNKLIPVNNSFAKPLTYATQISMNVSRDDQLLKLLADANFNLLIIGIETPNKESLKEVGKLHNIRDDLVSDIHKIAYYGIPIRSGIMVGFDHDDSNIFDIQYEFIQKACLASFSLNLVKAPFGTKLWLRLRRENRLLDISKLIGKGYIRITTNIIPKRMTRIELMRGFRRLMDKLHTWESFKERICNFVSLVGYRPNVPVIPLTDEELREIPLTLNVSPEGKKSIEEILDYTQKVAPFLLRRIIGLIVQFVRYQRTISNLLVQLDQYIEMESTGNATFDLDQRPIAFPPAFRQVYFKIFPEIYQGVAQNLVEKEAVPEALTEIFVDFLIRWGEKLDTFEDYHFEYLRELSDRTCAKLNRDKPAEVAPPVPDVKPGIRPKRIFHLAEDILKAVEHELFSLKIEAA